MPRISWSDRLSVNHLGNEHDGIIHVNAAFGFQEPTDICETLVRANQDYLEGAVDTNSATFFLSRIALHRTRQPGMQAWHKQLFIALARNATSQADQLCLPADRTVIVGSELEF